MGQKSAFLTTRLYIDLYRVPVTRLAMGLDPNFVPDVSLECTVSGVSGSHLSTEREHRKPLEFARFSQGERRIA